MGNAVLWNTPGLAFMIFSAASPSTGRITILSPGVAARSMMEEVGTAPLQKKASSLPSFSAATDSEAPSFSRLKSLFQS